MLIFAKILVIVKKLHIYLLHLVALLILVGGWAMSACTGAPPKEKIVTVSIEPQKYLLEKITGGKIQVRCLLTNGANPETYDPAMTHMINLQKSLGYLRMGNIGFEDALLDKIREANPDLPIFNTSEGVAPITGTHTHDDGMVHSGIDPHTWSSVKNAKVIVKNMYDAVCQLDPQNEPTYTSNYKAYTAHLDSLDTALTAKLAKRKGEPFLVWHPSLSYFARDYGLNQVVVGNAEHKDVAPGQLRNTIDDIRALDAKIFFQQKDFDSRQVEAVNSQIGAKTVNISPLAYDWEAELTGVADAIAAAPRSHGAHSHTHSH